MKKNVFVFILLITTFKSNAQELEYNSINHFNGIYRDRNDNKSYHLFYNGQFLFFYIDELNNVVNSLIRYGSYGFYPSSIETDNLMAVKLNKRGSLKDKIGFNFSSGGVLGYEYEVGDRTLNLYNQNAFFYERLYVLSPKIIAELRNIAKKEKINIDDFIYSDEIIGSPTATIYEKPNIRTKTYLNKGNIIKIIEENKDWLKFVYKGRKTITGWLKKVDLE